MAQKRKAGIPVWVDFLTDGGNLHKGLPGAEGLSARRMQESRDACFELGQPLTAHLQRDFCPWVKEPDNRDELGEILNGDDIRPLQHRYNGYLQAVFQVVQPGGEGGLPQGIKRLIHLVRFATQRFGKQRIKNQ